MPSDSLPEPRPRRIESIPADLDGAGRELVDRITPLVRAADERFVDGTRHWVRDCFLPELRAAGLTIVEADDV